MTRPPSILARVIAASADTLAQRLQVPPSNRQAFVSTVESVLYSQWATRFGGETVRVRFYAPQESQRQRDERRNRIVEALRKGEAPRVIAKREGVSSRSVYRVAQSVTAAGMEMSQAE
jgi:hypothetical protein